MQRPSTRLAASGLLALTATAPALGADYTFTNLGNTSGPYAATAPYFYYGGTLNDHGDAAFVAALDAGGAGIFTGPNPATDTFVDTAGPYDSVGGPASAFIPSGLDSNNTHTVFYADLDAGGQGLFYGTNPATDAIATTTAAGGSFTGITDDFALSGNGHYAFVGNDGVNGRGIYGGTIGNAPSLIISENTSPYDEFEGVSVSNDGSVVYRAHSKGQGGIDVEHFVLKDSIGETAFATSNTGSLFEDPIISDNGVILYNDSNEMYLTDSTLNTQLFSSSVFIAPTFNSLDEVAFTTFDGLYVSDGTTEDLVIQEGDTLFGDEVASIFRVVGFNDQGQVLFTYRNGDGTGYVALATPGVVPEPGSLALLGLGGLAMLGGRRRGADAKTRA